MTSHELFEPYEVKNNYGISQGPVVQLSLKKKNKNIET
jgi:hypothetical protein